MEKKISIILISVAVIIVVAVFVVVSLNKSSENINKAIVPAETQNTNSEQPAIETNQGSTKPQVLAWRDIALKDVRTGKEFKISDFNGQQVLIESFAVWCPTCTKQQGIIKDLHNELGDSFVSISLDTDPNEDEAKVLEHVNRNGFNWYYAIAPVDLTQSLIDEFGIGFVNAPSAPVVHISEEGKATFLKRGVKSSNELKDILGVR